jgi:NADPH-dependent 2,4-dienoyl-CoA reductase/sulfur reductase-like enzyme/nitrite reductase/ring-hydroxylating ferredoxin subunit
MGETRSVVGQAADFDDGDMTQVTVDGVDVLVAKVDGEFYANGAHCTHYGAPLSDGVLDQSGELICPWHHAVFDVTTGDHIESPGRDCLNHFAVEVDGGDIVVTVPEGASEERSPEMVDRDPSDDRHYVIIGGGQAGSTAAETLRREGFAGQITMVTADEYYPYDRPNLSKAYLSGEGQPDWLPLRPDSFWEDHGIDIRFGTRVEGLNPKSKRLELGDGTSMGYDRLLIATGGAPNRLPVDGIDLDGVFMLRDRGDCDAIIDRAKDAERAVIVGSSFIGLEVAAALRNRDIDVSVASMEEVPFENIFGRRVGRYFQSMHEQEGVDFHLGRRLDSIQGSDGRADSVHLDDGTRLEADLVVVGAGVHPATEFAEGALKRHDDGGIETDSTLKAHEDIWAAGDVARFPDLRTGRKVRIEHWQLAGQHGKLAAQNMLGVGREYTAVPFFWTRQFQKSFKYVGHADQWDEIVIDGDVDDGDFIAYYVEGDRVLAASGTRGGDLTYLQALMRHDALPKAEDLRSEAWPV